MCRPSSEATTAAAKTVVAVADTTRTRRPHRGFGLGSASLRAEYLLREATCSWYWRARRGETARCRRVQDAAKGGRVIAASWGSSAAAKKSLRD
jgi:hypothetical protein